MFVSVICPVFNEARYMAPFLDSLLAQTFPKERLEILIVDGLSQDGSREIVEQYMKIHPYFKLLDNPERFVSQALNKGIEACKGDIVVRMDIHADYPNDYIDRLVHYLVELKADNVGGSCNTLPGDDTTMSLAIARAISCRFGIGNSYFRLNTKKIMAVDTVPFGCFHRQIFDKIGLFDKDLIRNQDDEFNARILKYGGKIFLIPSIRINYYSRSTLGKLSKMYYQYGLFKPLVVKKTGSVVTWRQLVPVLFSLYLAFLLPAILFFFSPAWIFPLILYVLTGFSYATQFALKHRNAGLLIMPVVFFVIHVSYGTGYLRGIVKALSSQAGTANVGNSR